MFENVLKICQHTVPFFFPMQPWLLIKHAVVLVFVSVSSCRAPILETICSKSELVNAYRFFVRIASAWLMQSICQQHVFSSSVQFWARRLKKNYTENTVSLLRYFTLDYQTEENSEKIEMKIIDSVIKSVIDRSVKGPKSILAQQFQRRGSAHGQFNILGWSYRVRN